MNIYSTLLQEQIELFKYKFKLISKELFVDPQRNHKTPYYHSGEFGNYRENICRQFLRFFIHQRLDIRTGFIITPQQVSTQLDLVIYDKSHMPRIESHEYQRFYPIEAAAAIGEVKSVINSWQELSKTLVKLSSTKQLRESLYQPVSVVYPANQERTYNPHGYICDQLFTFLICEDVVTKKDEDFNGKIFLKKVDEIYKKEKIAYRNRHNLILIINRGIVMYKNHDGKILHYPCFPKDKSFINLSELDNHYIAISEQDMHIHFKHFMNSMCMGSSSVRILYPEIKHYVF